MRPFRFTVSAISLPMAATRVHAGFPSPAEDYIEAPVDPSRLLVGNRAATFLWRADGDCMVDAGIFPDDVMVVDRSLEAVDGDVVVVVVGGDFGLKRFRRRPGEAPSFEHDNARLEPYRPPPGTDWAVWGVVTFSLRPHGRARARR